MWVYWTYMGGAGRQYVVGGEGHHATHSCSFLIVLSRRIWFMFAETVLKQCPALSLQSRDGKRYSYQNLCDLGSGLVNGPDEAGKNGLLVEVGILDFFFFFFFDLKCYSVGSEWKHLLTHCGLVTTYAVRSNSIPDHVMTLPSHNLNQWSPQDLSHWNWFEK